MLPKIHRKADQTNPHHHRRHGEDRLYGRVAVEEHRQGDHLDGQCDVVQPEVGFGQPGLARCWGRAVPETEEGHRGPAEQVEVGVDGSEGVVVAGGHEDAHAHPDEDVKDGQT